MHWAYTFYYQHTHSFGTHTTKDTTINCYTSSQSNNHPDINLSVLKNTTPHTTTNLHPHATVLQTSNSIYTSPTKHPHAPSYKHFPHTNTPQHTNIQYTQPHTTPLNTPTTLQTLSLHLNPSSYTYPHLVTQSIHALGLHLLLPTYSLIRNAYNKRHHHQLLHLFTIQQPP